MPLFFIPHINHASPAETTMKDTSKTKVQLIDELVELRRRVTNLEATEQQLAIAEASLQDRSRRVKSLIENSLDAVAILNGDGTVRYQSHSMGRVLGYEGDNEVIGVNAFDYIHPDDKSKAASVLEQIKNDPKGPTHVEIRAQHNDGTWHTLELVLLNLLDDPIIDGIIANFWDITDRKRAEAVLRDSEKWFRALIENAADAITLVTADGTILYQSPSIERIGGYKPHEIIGRPMHEYIHPDDLSGITRSFAKIVKNPNTTDSMELKLRCVDGSWCDVEGIAKNLLDDPKVRAIVCNFRDITERKQAEKIQKEKGERLQAFIENSLDNVAILNSDGTIRYQSPSLGQVLGYESTDETGRSALDFLHPDDKSIAEVILTQLSDSINKPVHMEFRARHSDGSYHTLEVVLRNFLEDPIVGGILAHFRDITERKLAEESRIKHAAAVARTEELQRSRQRIVTMQESVRRDIAQQVHGSVQNRLIILMHRIAELEQSASTEESAKQLKDLHEKLVELLEMHVRPISHQLYPSILRRGLVVALQSLADQFETALDIEMDMDEVILRRERSDPRFIPEQVRLTAYRIAEEALTNAVKHAKESSINIKLTTLPEGWFHLTVEDNGPGFDIQIVANGLGTLMMQDYAEMVGGSCVIRSAPNEGTQIMTTLPLAGLDVEHPAKK